MNPKYSINNKFVALSAAASFALLLGACSKSDVSDQFVVTRPAKFEGVKDIDGGMCPIDSINRQLVSDWVTTSKKLPFAIDGWSVIGSKEKPVPPIIYGVLSGNNGNFYLEGKRKPRPDVAKGDTLLDLAGFEIAGYLSNVPMGEYSLNIATGDSDKLNICRTKILVRVVD